MRRYFIIGIAIDQSGGQVAAYSIHAGKMLCPGADRIIR